MSFWVKSDSGIVFLRLLQGKNIALTGTFEVQIREMPKEIDSGTFDAHCEKIFFEVLFANFETHNFPFFKFLLLKKMEVELIYFLIAVNNRN